MKRAFCTYFDHRYLPRGLALIASLRRNGSQDDIWILCLSPECHAILSQMAIPGVYLLRLSDIETAYPQLAAVRPRRSAIEYYFTTTPLVIEHVFARMPDADMVTYLDTDLYFFESPDLVFAEIGDAPVAIIPHNYPDRLKALERFGIYNVGWVSFRRVEQGMACLAWWAQSCLDWCFDEVDVQGRFADQGYLNNFAAIAPDTRIIRHPGMNLAPWNVANYSFQETDGKLRVDGRAIVFFHFHGLKKGFRYFYFNGHRVYHAPMGGKLRRLAYLPYVSELLMWEEKAARVDGGLPANTVLKRGAAGRHPGSLYAWLKDVAKFLIKLADIVTGRAILVKGGKAY